MLISAPALMSTSPIVAVDEALLFVRMMVQPLHVKRPCAPTVRSPPSITYVAEPRLTVPPASISLTHTTPVSAVRSIAAWLELFLMRLAAPGHGLNEGGLTSSKGSSCLTVNGSSSAPFQ